MRYIWHLSLRMSPYPYPLASTKVGKMDRSRTQDSVPKYTSGIDGTEAQATVLFLPSGWMIIKSSSAPQCTSTRKM